MPYTVRPDTTTKVISTSPIEIVNVPCWTVTHESEGMGWHIGKYDSPNAAKAVAAVLEVFESEKCD